MDPEFRAAFDELKAGQDAIREEMAAHREETAANFQVVRAQLNALEFSVLTIAQKLLAESEVREIQSRFLRKVSG